MISLICTVLNEGENIHRLMQSILHQSRQPDEIVIVDGGSSDDTAAILQTYTDRLPLRLIVAPGSSISQGRNRALQEAKGDIIAVTDAGVRLSDTWLEAITGPLLNDPGIAVVSGFFQADPHSLFEVAMGATVLPLEDEIDPATFLPSSRSIAFRKSASEAVGGYPEWLDYCEDLIFDLRLKQTTAPFVFAPDALVFFQPRSTLKAFFRQYYLYARGDGKANLWLKRHVVRYATYLLMIPLVALLGAFIHPVLWGLYLIGGALYLYPPYRRLPLLLRRWKNASAGAWLYTALMIPVIRVTGDVAKMVGYPVGLSWRMCHRPPDWQQISSQSPLAK